MALLDQPMTSMTARSRTPRSKLVESSDPTPLNGSALRPGRRASVLVDGLGRCGGCIEWSVSATAPAASPSHLALAAVDIPALASRAAPPYRRPAPWPSRLERVRVLGPPVALRAGARGGVLAAAPARSPAWDQGGPPGPAAWAQIRIGAGIARRLKDEPDGAAQQARPVFDLPP